MIRNLCHLIELGHMVTCVLYTVGWGLHYGISIVERAGQYRLNLRTLEYEWVRNSCWRFTAVNDQLTRIRFLDAGTVETSYPEVRYWEDEWERTQSDQDPRPQDWPAQTEGTLAGSKQKDPESLWRVSTLNSAKTFKFSDFSISTFPSCDSPLKMDLISHYLWAKYLLKGSVHLLKTSLPANP